ncbi:PLASTID TRANSCRIPTIONALLY ACTIVE protein 6, chloroplastic [Castilleja foliolosa]|uniref:PLASTID TRANSCRIPTIONALLY ACTIVE protein 6, chloroplastic n=1 Tax=Castilleja foliolosa TaxID=1961234 RepID=A0ABD3CYJ6_9LAMI
MNAAATLLFTPIFPLKPPTVRSISLPKHNIRRTLRLTRPIASRRDFRVWADDGDADGGEPDDYDMDDDEVEEVDNKKDFDVDYDTGAALVLATDGNGGDDIAMVHSKSFVSTQGWGSEKIVDYRINEDEFHKICLLDCDFFIRKPPDPDNDVYDFREMYVTPPDTDIYAIPKVLAPMPQKYIRCAQSDYGLYNVTEPPIDAPRDPLYKSEREIQKVFLTKHYRNRRLGDPEFVLDFEEIYVLDSKTKSISRAKVVVTIPGGRDRDRKNDLLVVRDKGNSFKIIPSEERDNPTTIIEKEDWDKSRADMEKHLSKLRDFNVSNWF